MTSCRWWHSHLCNDWAPEYWSTSHSGCATIASRSYQEDGITWWKYQVFVVTRLARLALCRQSCLGFSSITFISSNWNDKLRSYSRDSSTLPVSTNPCQRGEIWWHSYRRERTLAAIITTKNSSELLTQLFKISKRNPKQTNYRNLRRNYWSCPSGITWKHKQQARDVLATSSNAIS